MVNTNHLGPSNSKDDLCYKGGQFGPVWGGQFGPAEPVHYERRGVVNLHRRGLKFRSFLSTMHAEAESNIFQNEIRIFVTHEINRQ